MKIIKLLSDNRWRTVEEIAERVDMDRDDVIEFCTPWVNKGVMLSDVWADKIGKWRMYRMVRGDEL